ncbi:MAG: PAS domain-containing protein [Symploca sp. SIO2C1]|nr:PAS domain-containing protein [Symploca sp. SIO2C1]
MRVHPRIGKRATNSMIYQVGDYLRQQLHYFNPRRYLSVQLGLAIAGFALFLSTLTSVTISYHLSHKITVKAGQYLVQMSHNLTEFLDGGMFERYREIQMVATLPSIRSGNTPRAQKRMLLEKLKKTYPDYAWIGLTNLQGKVIASTDGLLEGQNISAKDWFQAAKEGTYVGDVHEVKWLAKLLPNETGEPLRFIDLATPIFDNQGKLEGVVGAHLSWEWAKKMQADLLQSQQKKEQVEGLILAKDGTVLLGPPQLQFQKLNLKSLEMADTRKPSYQVETWSNGNQYLVGLASTQGFGDYPGLGWRVLTRQPTAIAFATVRELRQDFFEWGFILSILFATLVCMVSEQMTSPLVDITAVAERIRRGDTTVKIPVKSGKNEVAKLSVSLNRLVSTLTKQEQTLQITNQQLQQELRERKKTEKSLRESQQRFRQIAENIQEIFWIASFKFNQLLYISPAYEKIFGHSCDLLYQDPTSWLQFVHPQDRINLKEVLNIHKKKAKKIDIKFRIVRPNGAVRWLWCQAFPIKDKWNNFYRSTGVLVDITQQKRAEDLEKQKITLEHEIALREQAEAEIRRSLEQEKELNELKSRFISMASHEFRTPLTTIMSSAELLEYANINSIKKKKEKHVARIKSSTKRMIQMIEEVLLIEKGEAGKIQLKPVSLDLKQVCLELVEQIQQSAAKNCQINYVVQGQNRSVCLDEKCLQHILLNLLSNAVKYSSECSTVDFILTWKDTEVVFQVKDQGIGIPPQDKKRLFEGFHRAENVGTIPGTGLGLVIVKQFVDLHQGRIAVESEVGVGTTFTVTLPV